MTQMSTIGISPRFFETELNNYSNWRTSFWRELIQNSVDEGCTLLELETEPDPENPQGCIARCRDNGPGMSEETLRNVYFQLGETSKTARDTIGGHGRARILTCFAHKSYTILTQGLRCQGTGGSYNIQEWTPTKGCLVEVRITAASAEDMANAATSYLESCQLPCPTLLNKEPFTQWQHRRRATRSLPFGTVHVSQKFGFSTILRVRGVTMFTRYSGCEKGAIIEIDPARARNVLTASRDSLKSEEQKMLDDFLAEITVDKNSIGRACLENQTRIFGTFRLSGPQKENNQEQEQEEEPRATHQRAAMAYPNPVAWECAQTYMVPGGCTPEILEATGQPETPIPYAIHTEDLPKRLGASSRRFDPENLAGNRLKLLLAWQETITLLLEEINLWKNHQCLFMPGFCFGDFEGLHKEEKTPAGTGHILCINPIDNQGRLRISHLDTERLYATGAHECIHTIQDWHDEIYASLLTQLIERTCNLLPTLRKRIALATKPHKILAKNQNTQENQTP
jgi:hypothetical protein